MSLSLLLTSSSALLVLIPLPLSIRPVLPSCTRRDSRCINQDRLQSYKNAQFPLFLWCFQAPPDGQSHLRVQGQLVSPSFQIWLDMPSSRPGCPKSGTVALSQPAAAAIRESCIQALSSILVPSRAWPVRCINAVFDFGLTWPWP